MQSEVTRMHAFKLGLALTIMYAFKLGWTSLKLHALSQGRFDETKDALISMQSTRATLNSELGCCGGSR